MKGNGSQKEPVKERGSSARKRLYKDIGGLEEKNSHTNSGGEIKREEKEILRGPGGSREEGDEM